MANYKSVTLEDLQKLQNGELDTWEFLHSNGEYLDIDKTWQIIRYVLTGTAMGCNGNILDNITPYDWNNVINDEDMGMGPAMYINNITVKEISNKLEKFTKENFKENISIEDMVEKQIYPIYEDDDVQEIFEYSYPYFLELKDYFARTSNENKYIIFWLS